MKHLFKLALLSSLLFSAVTFADTVHTWHNVSTENGTWTGNLQPIYEQSSFVDANGAPVSNFIITQNQPMKYGFIYAPGDDFNVAYTLTLVQQSTANFQSKSCVFVITALKPRTPDIRVSSFHGAVCNYKVVPGEGEDFFVS